MLPQTGARIHGGMILVPTRVSTAAHRATAHFWPVLPEPEDGKGCWPAVPGPATMRRWASSVSPVSPGRASRASPLGWRERSSGPNMWKATRWPEGSQRATPGRHGWTSGTRDASIASTRRSERSSSTAFATRTLAYSPIPLPMQASRSSSNLTSLATPYERKSFPFSAPVRSTWSSLSRPMMRPGRGPHWSLLSG